MSEPDNDKLAKLITTSIVSNSVEGSMRAVLKVMSEISNEEPVSETEKARYANFKDILANQDKIKAIFIDALDEAVYGNGGRQGENKRIIKGEKTSWQEQLMTGPVKFDQRMRAARDKVNDQINTLSVSSKLTMELYDLAAQAVSAEIKRDLAAGPAR